MVDITIGVLALQGDFAPHAEILDQLGVNSKLVKNPDDLEQIDGLIIPGGESTAISLLLKASDLLDPLKTKIANGMAVLGTCAGMILLASQVLDGRDDQISLSAIDISVRRNGFGRQIDSFETDLELKGQIIHAVFIRAPIVASVGEGVEVLATHGDQVVLCRQNNILVASFHPELKSDGAIHNEFLSMVTRSRKNV